MKDGEQWLPLHSFFPFIELASFTASQPHTCWRVRRWRLWPVGRLCVGSGRVKKRLAVRDPLLPYNITRRKKKVLCIHSWDSTPCIFSQLTIRFCNLFVHCFYILNNGNLFYDGHFLSTFGQGGVESLKMLSLDDVVFLKVAIKLFQNNEKEAIFFLYG